MKNRAKCKLCNSIIESFHQYDMVLCKCEEIYVDAGEAMKCGAKDWKNFVRVDEDGNEVIPKYPDQETIEKSSKPSKEELLQMLDDMVKSYDRLPAAALSTPATNADLLSILLLVRSLFDAV